MTDYTTHEPPLTGLARLGYIVPTPQTPHDNARETLTRVLDQVCPVPDPYESSGAFARYHHEDLSAMSSAELRRERRSVRCRLDLEERPCAWLWERLEAIRQTLALRKTPRRAPPPPGGPEAEQPPAAKASASHAAKTLNKPPDFVDPWLGRRDSWCGVPLAVRKPTHDDESDPHL